MSNAEAFWICKGLDGFCLNRISTSYSACSACGSTRSGQSYTTPSISPTAPPFHPSSPLPSTSSSLYPPPLPSSYSPSFPPPCSSDSSSTLSSSSSSSSPSPSVSYLDVPVEILIFTNRGTTRDDNMALRLTNFPAPDREEVLTCKTLMTVRVHRDKSMPTEHIRLHPSKSDTLSLFSECLVSSLPSCRLQYLHPSLSFLFFVHGFNNSPYQAAERAARIWAALQTYSSLEQYVSEKLRNPESISPLAAVFCWPSAEKATAYPTDEQRYVSSQSSVREALESFIRFAFSSASSFESLPRDLHLIAHSMGTRLLLSVLALSPKIVETVTSITLAAPDVATIDAEQFLKGMFKHLDESQKKKLLFSVYYSNADLVLDLSRIKHANTERRLGGDKLISLEEFNCVVIDCTDRCRLRTCHDYLFADPQCMLDLHLALTDKISPNMRSTLQSIDSRKLIYAVRSPPDEVKSTQQQKWDLTSTLWRFFT